MLLIWRDHTSAKPTMLLLDFPRLTATDRTPRNPVAAMVSTENRSVTILIHLVQMF